MKTIKMFLVASFMFSATAFSVAVPDVALAHENKLDSMGCHYARGHRNYHCHEGKLKGRTFKSRAEAIRNFNRLKRDDNGDSDDDDGFPEK